MTAIGLAKAKMSNAAMNRAALGYSKPASYEELRAVLSSGTVRLPGRLQKVAIFMWQRPGDVALGTVTALGRQAGVQPSAIVRFAQALGYSGFSDLQAVFKAYVQSGWPGGGEGGVAPMAGGGDGDGAGGLLEGFVQASAASLARIAGGLDVAGLERMAAVLVAADLIYIVGSKRAFAVASHVSLALAKLGVRNMLVDNVGSAAFEHVRCALARDAILAIGFTPYNSITPELVASAVQRGVPAVSITDSAFSPLVPLSQAHVEVREDDFSGFKSLAATMAVAMALALRVAKLRGVA